MVITLFDIPSTAPGSAWSPNVWKIRYILNLKKIPYRTEWVEYPDIQSVSKARVIAPTQPATDSTSAKYTLPAIYDSSTGTALAESSDIAEYLDNTYPDQAVFPPGTKGIQFGFVKAFEDAIQPLGSLITFPLFQFLTTERSKQWFRQDREPLWGKKLENVSPKGETLLSSGRL